MSLRFGFWLNVVLSAINLGLFFTHGGALQLIVGLFNAWVAYRLRFYA